MAIKLYKFDAADYIRTSEDVQFYLEAALEENDPEFFQEALGTVARSRGMKLIAQNSKSTRAGLYKALNASGNPEFATIHRVMNALGYRFGLHRLQPTKPVKKAVGRLTKKPAKKIASGKHVTRNPAKRKRAGN
jgi:probable addiction module antidote protein